MPAPEVSNVETLLLERLELGLNMAISKHLLSGVRVDGVDAVASDLTHSIVYKLRAHVWSDPRRDYRKTHEVVYDQAHPDWRYHLVASLSEGSFLRRFFHFLWDIPLDYRKTRVTETIEVHVPTIFPENTMHYPEHLGRAHHPITIASTGVERARYYD